MILYKVKYIKYKKDIIKVPRDNNLCNINEWNDFCIENSSRVVQEILEITETIKFKEIELRIADLYGWSHVEFFICRYLSHQYAAVKIKYKKL